MSFLSHGLDQEIGRLIGKNQVSLWSVLRRQELRLETGMHWGQPSHPEFEKPMPHILPAGCPRMSKVRLLEYIIWKWLIVCMCIQRLKNISNVLENIKLQLVVWKGLRRVVWERIESEVPVLRWYQAAIRAGSNLELSTCSQEGLGRSTWDCRAHNGSWAGPAAEVPSDFSAPYQRERVWPHSFALADTSPS